MFFANHEAMHKADFSTLFVLQATIVVVEDWERG